MLSKILPVFLLAISIDAFAVTRMKCAPAQVEAPEGAEAADYDVFFASNGIIPKTQLSPNFIEQFKVEFLKFPFPLHQELLSAGARIHLIEGEGVTEDPTWDPAFTHTFDGRPWNQVPGAGGSVAKEYSKSPTRIVINHLYDKQGSASMFLHEYGHNLDSINSFHGISHSQAWTDLLASEPNAMPFLSVICGAYCTNNVEEGFAELLANYHGCEETRVQMEQEVPRIAEFFKRFNSTKNLSSIMNDEVTAAETTEEVPAPVESEGAPVITSTEPENQIPLPKPEQGRRPRLGCRRVFGREVCI